MAAMGLGLAQNKVQSSNLGPPSWMMLDGFRVTHDDFFLVHGCPRRYFLGDTVIPI